jgi:hypothetical protein
MKRDSGGIILVLALVVVLVMGLIYYASSLDRDANTICAQLGYSSGYEQLLTGATYCVDRDQVRHKIE